MSLTQLTSEIHARRKEMKQALQEIQIVLNNYSLVGCVTVLQEGLNLCMVHLDRDGSVLKSEEDGSCTIDEFKETALGDQGIECSLMDVCGLEKACESAFYLVSGMKTLLESHYGIETQATTLTKFPYSGEVSGEKQ
jgi:hypothetical protein